MSPYRLQFLDRFCFKSIFFADYICFFISDFIFSPTELINTALQLFQNYNNFRAGFQSQSISALNQQIPRVKAQLISEAMHLQNFLNSFVFSFLPNNYNEVLELAHAKFFLCSLNITYTTKFGHNRIISYICIFQPVITIVLNYYSTHSLLVCRNHNCIK